MGLDAVASIDGNLLDLAGHLGIDRRLHLHRFDDEEPLAPFDALTRLYGDADDEATQLVDKYMNVVDSVYELIGVVQNFSEKVPSGKENSVDTPVQYREALFLIKDLKKMIGSIINTRTSMNTLSDIRKEYGTITAFNRLPSRQQREWFERSTGSTISLMDLLSVLAGAQ